MLSKTGALPAGVSFTDNGDDTATIAGTPAAGTGGSYPLTIKASNGVSPDATQTFTLTVNEAPAVTTNPSSQIKSVGDPVTFSAAATGNPAPSVKWQRSTDGGGSFSDIPGATNATYSFVAAAGQNGFRFRAVFTNAVNNATSAAAILTLTPRTLSVSTAGNGAGTVDGAGIDCGGAGHSDCAETVPDGDQITLTAHPSPNSEFAGFSGGGCADSGSPCTVSMNAAKSVTATFTAVLPAPPEVPETTIGHGPHNAKPAHTHFRFRSSIPGSTFSCSLDDSAPQPCTSPKDYRNLEPGRHVFRVTATAPNGQTDPSPAKARFRIFPSAD